MKLDANGNKLWDKSIGNTNSENLETLQQTSDGGYILGGAANLSQFGGWDYWIVKIDAAGNKVWDKFFGGSEDDALSAVRQTSDGGYILGGYSRSGVSGNKFSPNYGSFDYWLLRLDPNGNKVSDNSFGGTGSDYLETVRRTTDGGCILGGHSNSGASGNKTSGNFGGDDLWVVKLLTREVPFGTPLVRINGQNNSSNSYSVNATYALLEIQSIFSNAHIYYTLDGSTASSNSASYSGGVPLYSSATVRAIAYNSDFSASPQADRVSLSVTLVSFFLSNVGNGSITPNTNLFEFGQQVTLTATPRVSWWQFVRWSDGNTTNPRSITVGASNSFSAIFTNIVPVQELVFKQWEAVFGGTSNDTLYSAQQTSDGGLILGGASESPISGNKSASKYGGYDLWLVRLDANGQKVWDNSYGGNLDEGNYAFNFSLAQSRDGGYILGSRSDSGISGNKTTDRYAPPDGWAVKINSLGDRQWDKDFGGNNADAFSVALQSSDGGYLLAGESWSTPSVGKTSTNYGGNDGWAIKLYPDGSKQWENLMELSDRRAFRPDNKRPTGVMCWRAPRPPVLPGTRRAQVLAATIFGLSS